MSPTTSGFFLKSSQRSQVVRAGPFARGWWMAQDGEAWRPGDVALDIGYMLPWVSRIWKSKGSRENGGIHKNAIRTAIKLQFWKVQIPFLGISARCWGTAIGGNPHISTTNHISTYKQTWRSRFPHLAYCACWSCLRNVYAGRSGWKSAWSVSVPPGGRVETNSKFHGRRWLKIKPRIFGVVSNPC